MAFTLKNRYETYRFREITISGWSDLKFDITIEFVLKNKFRRLMSYVGPYLKNNQVFKISKREDSPPRGQRFKSH